VIRRLSEKEPNDTRSPFFDTSGRPMQPFAKLVLRRQRIYPKSCESTQLPQMENHEIVVSENSEDVGRRKIPNLGNVVVIPVNIS